MRNQKLYIKTIVCMTNTYELSYKRARYIANKVGLHKILDGADNADTQSVDYWAECTMSLHLSHKNYKDYFKEIRAMAKDERVEARGYVDAYLGSNQ